jgi:beta-galactosidase
MKSIFVLFSAVVFVSALSARTVTDLSGSGWTLDGEAVVVPHTWNAKDGADGLGPVSGNSASAKSYLRRRGTYRRSLNVAQQQNRRQFIRCLGAAQKATVRVNGIEIGRHVGAYTAFAFEATKYLKQSGNVLEIEVDNFLDPDVQPSGADFTVYGGLYRGVELIETDSICIDCVTDGADGVVIEPNADTGEVVVRVSVDGGTNEIQRFSFPKPELWSPETPRLYEIAVTIAQEGSVDTVRKTFGFRKAEFREDGFYLNGVKRKIRGVNMHADLDGYGWALPAGQRARDIAMVKEMGADGIRTAHYPHADETYLECDKQGLLAWCEYPNVGKFTPTETYRRNALQGLREMVAQLRHHPSIIVWSVSNEYKTNAVSTAWVERLLRDFSSEVKRLDPSRPSAAATFQAFLTGPNAIPDVLGFNFYPGWYRRNADEMRETVDAALSVTDRKMIGVTEYGAGGNADCHASPEVRNAPRAPFHSEEYQAWVHHFNYEDLRDDPRVWGTFIWLMFDFAADIRREGSRFGLNDKGLVGFDHSTRKDAFFFYKANWNPEPMLHLVGTRMTATTNESVTVMGFSNVGDVTLTLNGVQIGTKSPDSVNTVIWRNVKLIPGANSIRLTAGGIVREVVWNRKVAR